MGFINFVVWVVKVLAVGAIALGAALALPGLWMTGNTLGTLAAAVIGFIAFLYVMYEARVVGF